MFFSKKTDGRFVCKGLPFFYFFQIKLIHCTFHSLLIIYKRKEFKGILIDCLPELTA